MKLIFKHVLFMTFLCLSTTAISFEVDGEKISLTGKITDITLSDAGGIINVEADNEKYGKTWLTYNIKLSNPGSSDQGSFHGRAVAINNEGSRNSATRQGLWSRNDYIYSFLSLDDVSDGNQYLCITEMNVKTNTVEMQFYAR